MAWWTWGALTGALVKRVPVTVVNLSRGGCLIQTAAPLEPGLVGVLAVNAGNVAKSEAIRVAHASRRPGASMPFSAGMEFLVLDTAGVASIREEAFRAESGRRPSRLAMAGENSGTKRTTPKVRDEHLVAEMDESPGDSAES